MSVANAGGGFETRNPVRKHVMNTFPVLLAMNGIIIPVVAIVMGISIPLVHIYTDYRRKQTMFELHHRERMAAIEKGLELPPLPPELMRGFGQSEPRPRNPRRALLTGLIWLAIGIGLAVALGLERDGLRDAAKGLIPIGIGLAYLIYYAVEGKNEIAEIAEIERKNQK